MEPISPELVLIDPELARMEQLRLILTAEVRRSSQNQARVRRGAAAQLVEIDGKWLVDFLICSPGSASRSAWFISSRASTDSRAFGQVPVGWVVDEVRSRH
jgi:hypothetical protein